MNLSYDKVTRVIAKSLSLMPEELRQAFVPADVNDIGLILEFRREYLGNHIKWDDARYIEWRYDFSPFTSTTADFANRLWRIKINGQILALIGVDYAEFISAGKIQHWRNPLDLLVRADVDGLGLGVWMSLVLEKEYPQLFAMGATRHSQSIVKKLFDPMPDLGAWKLILSTHSLIARRFSNPLMQWLLRTSLDLYLRIKLGFKFLNKPANCEIKIIDNFISYEDDLIKLNQTYQSSPILCRYRTAKFLNWRFLRNPRREYKAMGVVVEGKLQAYLVYHESNKKYLEIDDLWTASGNSCYVKSVVSVLVKLAYEQHLQVISFITHPHVYQTSFRSLGFRWRDDGHLFSIFTQQPSESLHRIENWHLTNVDTHSEGF